MPDFIDKSVDAQQEILDAQISKMRQVQKEVTLRPRGSCHYCEEQTTLAAQLFCDIDCSNDYNKYVRRS